MPILTQRAKGEQIDAATLYNEIWNQSLTREDPRLNMPCLVWEAIDEVWWKGPGQGCTDDDNDEYAHIWTPLVLFSEGYVNSHSRNTVLSFLELPKPPQEIPAAVEVIMEWGAAASYIEKHKCMFLVMSKASKRYLSRNFLSHTECRVNNRDHAGIFDPDEIGIYRFGEAPIDFEMLPDGWKPPKVFIPVHHILRPKMIEALKLMPDNEVIRTQIWSIIKTKIPDDKKTYEEIKTWIEENYDPKPSGLFRPPLDDLLNTVQAEQAERPLTQYGFDIEVNTRRHVNGNCNYSANERGSGLYIVNRRIIEAAANEAHGDAQLFRSALARMLTDEVLNEPPEDTEDRDVETYDREVTESDALRVDYDLDHLVDRAFLWLARYHPDQAEALNPGYLEDSPEDEDPDDDTNQ